MSALKLLLPGELVVVHPARFYHAKSVEKIERVTATQIVLKSGRYNRETGRLVGGDSTWGSRSIHAPEPGEIEEIRLARRSARLANDLSNVNWPALTLEQLEQIAAIALPGQHNSSPPCK